MVPTPIYDNETVPTPFVTMVELVFGSTDGFEDLGDISAVPIGRSVPMSCDACRVTWLGCADVFECPRCGEPQRFWQEEPASTCQVCADRGDTHIPEDDFETYSRED